MQSDHLLKVIEDGKLPRSKYTPTIVSTLEQFSIDLCINPYRISPVYNDAEYNDMHDFHFLLSLYLYHYARGLRWFMDNITEVGDVITDMKKEFERCVASISEVVSAPEEYSLRRLRKLTAQLEDFRPDVYLIYPRRIVQLLSPGQINRLAPRWKELSAINDEITTVLVMMKSKQGLHTWSYGKDKRYLNAKQCILSLEKNMLNKGVNDSKYFAYYFPPYYDGTHYLAESMLWKRYQEQIVKSMRNKPLITRYILERKDIPVAIDTKQYIADLAVIYRQIRNIITSRRSIITSGGNITIGPGTIIGPGHSIISQGNITIGPGIVITSRGNITIGASNNPFLTHDVKRNGIYQGMSTILASTPEIITQLQGVATNFAINHLCSSDNIFDILRILPDRYKIIVNVMSDKEMSDFIDGALPAPWRLIENSTCMEYNSAMRIRAATDGAILGEYMAREDKSIDISVADLLMGSIQKWNPRLFVIVGGFLNNRISGDVNSANMWVQEKITPVRTREEIIAFYAGRNVVRSEADIKREMDYDQKRFDLGPPGLGELPVEEMQGLNPNRRGDIILLKDGRVIFHERYAEIEQKIYDAILNSALVPISEEKESADNMRIYINSIREKWLTRYDNKSIDDNLVEFLLNADPVFYQQIDDLYMALWQQHIYLYSDIHEMSKQLESWGKLYPKRAEIEKYIDDSVARVLIADID